MTVGQYWRLERPAPFDGSREEVIDALRAKLQESVTLRMVSDVPLGCFLSGGVDSSSVVAMMSRVSAEPVKTFSIGFASARFNELGYARVVAERFGTEHHEFTVEPDAVAVLPADRPSLRGAVRGFIGSADLVPVGACPPARDGGAQRGRGRRAARGISVVPDRAGARSSGALDACMDPVAHRALPSPGSGRGLPGWARACECRRPSDLRACAGSSIGAPSEKLYSNGQLAACGAAAEDLLARYYDGFPGDDLDRMQYTDMMTYLPEDLLVKVDRMTMAHSLEARSPLLDHELIEFCARIPSTLKVDRRGGKAIFRDAMAGLFPAEFLRSTQGGVRRSSRGVASRPASPGMREHGPPRRARRVRARCAGGRPSARGSC